jgi:hypothetical protein
MIRQPQFTEHGDMTGYEGKIKLEISHEAEGVRVRHRGR